MARALISPRLQSAIIPVTWGIAIAITRPPWYVVGVTALAVWGLLRRGGTTRTRLKFTREGRYLVAITLGVGFAAVNTGNNLLYLVLGMLLSMIVVSGILSEQTLRRLKVERELPRTVHAGRPFLTAITLTNRKARLPSFSIQVEDLLAAGGAKKCYFLKVPAGARQQTSYRAVVEHRGLHRYVGLRLGTRFPFAFFIKSRQIAVEDTLVVYPRIHPVDALPLAAHALIGALTRPRKGMGREFHGLRAYRLGDDARDVHWKRSAREGRLVLREYASQGARRVVLQVNTARAVDGTPAGGKPSPKSSARLLDASCDLAASLTVHLQQRGYRVELRCGPRPIDISDQGAGLDAAFHALAVVDFDTPQCAAPLPHGVPVVLVTPAETRGVAGAGFAHVVEPA
ncbi:MAG: hypothetical protein ACI9U2_003927 [Bradymonadia bacterium]|jgi:uncharacterized protein (DUF58 family)